MIEIKRNDDQMTKRIKTRINEKGYKTQKDFCESIGIDQPLLSDIFKGKRRTNDNIKLIADNLDCSFDYLMGFSDDNTLDLEVKDVLKKTGLSFESYQTLSEWLMRNNRFNQIINELLKDPLQAYELLEELDSFLSYLPTEEKLDDLRRSEKEEIYLRRLNSSLISFKYKLDEAIDSLEEHLKNIDQQLEKVNKELKNCPNDQKHIQKRFHFINQAQELNQRKKEIERELAKNKGDYNNGKK